MIVDLSRRNSLLSRLAKASMSDNQAHKPLRWVAFLPVSLADCVCGVIDLICSPFAWLLALVGFCSTLLSLDASSKCSIKASSNVVWWWLLACNSRGLPTASKLPCCISEIRSQRTASLIKWVETKMVIRCSRDNSTNFSKTYPLQRGQPLTSAHLKSTL